MTTHEAPETVRHALPHQIAPAAPFAALDTSQDLESFNRACNQLRSLGRSLMRSDGGYWLQTAVDKTSTLKPLWHNGYRSQIIPLSSRIFIKLTKRGPGLTTPVLFLFCILEHLF